MSAAHDHEFEHAQTSASARGGCATQVGTDRLRRRGRADSAAQNCSKGGGGNSVAAARVAAALATMLLGKAEQLPSQLLPAAAAAAAAAAALRQNSVRMNRIRFMRPLEGRSILQGDLSSLAGRRPARSSLSLAPRTRFAARLGQSRLTHGSG